MTEVAIDDRPIAAESVHYSSRLVRREDLTDSLAFFWVKADGDFIASLMAPCWERGKFASWISAPEVGIDNKAGDFEYVKIHQA